MDLPTYIDEVGLAEAARQFGASYSAIAMWRRRHRFPRREKAVEIERVTKGKVTVAEIFSVKA